MKKLNIILFLSLSIFVFTQVGIGTTAPSQGASLQVTSSTKGALIPRVALLNNTDQTTISSPAEGLMVYNTADNGTGTQQVFKDNFYFWDGVKWDQCVNSKEFEDRLAAISIPKLAGYMYKNKAHKYYSPTGDLVIDFAQTNNVFRFSPYLDFNANDPTKETFRIGTTGRYGFEAFGCMLMQLTTGETVHPEVVIQKSSDEGANWVDTPIVGTAEYDVSYTQGLTIPVYLTGVAYLNQDDLLRMVVRVRFSNSVSYSNINYLSIEKSNGLGVQYSAGFKAVYYP